MQNYDIQHKQPLGIHQGSFYNPWGLAFVLIFLFLFQLVFYFLALFTAGLYYNLPIADIQNILSEPDGTALAINIARYTNIVSFTGYMFLPALLFGIINRTGLLVEGGLKIKPKSQLVFLSVLIVGLCIPLVEYLTQVMHHIQWPQSVQFLAEKFDNARTEQINTILDMHSLPELILCILAIGLLPALFEEMMFRGILLNIFKNIAIRKWTPIVLQALVFTVLHFSFYEFPGIFMMGIIFGIIAYKTGTIWYGVLMHFIFNSSSVMIAYFNNQAFDKTGVYGKYGNIPFNLFMAIAAFAGLVILFRLFNKSNTHSLAHE